MKALLSTQTQPVTTPSAQVAIVPNTKTNDQQLNDQIIKHLSDRGYITFNRALAERFGHRTALFLGVCLYWTRHGALHAPKRQGWFYMPVQQMTDATTLSRREQETVRKELR